MKRKASKKKKHTKGTTKAKRSPSTLCRVPLCKPSPTFPKRRKLSPKKGKKKNHNEHSEVVDPFVLLPSILTTNDTKENNQVQNSFPSKTSQLDYNILDGTQLRRSTRKRANVDYRDYDSPTEKPSRKRPKKDRASTPKRPTKKNVQNTTGIIDLDAMPSPESTPKKSDRPTTGVTSKTPSKEKPIGTKRSSQAKQTKKRPKTQKSDSDEDYSPEQSDMKDTEFDDFLTRNVLSPPARRHRLRRGRKERPEPWMKDSLEEHLSKLQTNPLLFVSALVLAGHRYDDRLRARIRKLSKTLPQALTEEDRKDIGVIVQSLEGNDLQSNMSIQTVTSLFHPVLPGQGSKADKFQFLYVAEQKRRARGGKELIKVLEKKKTRGKHGNVQKGYCMVLRNPAKHFICYSGSHELNSILKIDTIGDASKSDSDDIVKKKIDDIVQVKPESMAKFIKEFNDMPGNNGSKRFRRVKIPTQTQAQCGTCGLLSMIALSVASALKPNETKRNVPTFSGYLRYWENTSPDVFWGDFMRDGMVNVFHDLLAQDNKSVSDKKSKLEKPSSKVRKSKKSKAGKAKKS